MKRSDVAARQQPIYRFLIRLEDGVLVSLLLIIIGMAVSQIILRNVFSTGIIWGDVLVRILVLWITMIGAMVASRRGEHINIDVLTRFLPAHARRRLTGAVAVLTAGICAIAAYHSYRFVASEFTYGGTAFAKVPVWLCEAIIPIGFSVIGLRYLIIGLHSIWPPPTARQGGMASTKQDP